MHSIETPSAEPSGSSSRQLIVDDPDPTQPLSRTGILARAGVAQAFADRLVKPRIPLPHLPADTPPSVALRAVKAAGDRDARYQPHHGARQIARQQRQEANRLRNAERRVAITSAHVPAGGDTPHTVKAEPS